jgi:hypothetical protein
MKTVILTVLAACGLCTGEPKPRIQIAAGASKAFNTGGGGGLTCA